MNFRWATGVSIFVLGCAAPMGGALAQEPATIDAAACAALADEGFDSAVFDLPSGEASIEEARFVAAAAETTGDNGQRVREQPDYCRILGAIAPVGDAPPIGFQINLPGTWNGKMVQYGGAGFNGVLTTGLTTLRDARPDTPTPLMQGYATAGTDSGHRNEDLPEIQAFALNEEALENFAHASYKKLRDLSGAMLERAYGRAPERVYYFGSSEGGREGLMMAQRYPADFDGIVTSVPVNNWTGLQSAGTRIGQLQLSEAAWLSPDAVAVLHRATLEQCDALDGLEDGVIGNQAGCAAIFDLSAYVCEPGSEGDCLTPEQAEVAQAIRAPFEFGLSLADDVTQYPGFPFGGENQPDGMNDWLGGAERPTSPGAASQSRGWYFGNGATRYFLAQDADYDAADFRLEDFADRASEVSALMDAMDPDLSAFAERGGRMILKENMADYAQSPYSSVQYYDSVRETLGAERVDEFVRFYAAAGANHNGGVYNGRDGAPLPSRIDFLEMLDAWVVDGEAPGSAATLSLHEEAAPFGEVATRPLCSHPAYPHYREGDPASADSFECVEP